LETAALAETFGNLQYLKQLSLESQSYAVNFSSEDLRTRSLCVVIDTNI
jgi:hypothetical protein